MLRKLFILLFVWSLSGCYVELVDNVSIRESIKIESILIENGIVPQSIKSKDGYTIQVKDIDRLRAISLLSFYDLPSLEIADIQELFPPGELVASPFAEKNRLVYGISNNLKKTIESIPGVITSSVDLAYMADSDNKNNQKSDNKASVVIVYQSPLMINANFIEQIKAIVVNANPDIHYKNVSVNTFRKEYTPLTSDLVAGVDHTMKYIYVFVFLILFSILGFAIYGYAKVKLKN